MQYAANNGHDILTNGVKLYMRWNESGFYFLYKILDKTNGIACLTRLKTIYDAASQDVTQDKCDGDTFEFWLTRTKSGYRLSGEIGIQPGICIQPVRRTRTLYRILPQAQPG